MSVRYYVDPQHEILRVVFDEALSEDLIPFVIEKFTQYYEQGIRRLIIDRRKGTKLDIDRAKQFGNEMGELGQKYCAKVAIIMNEDDLLERVVCGGSLNSGLDFLMTVSEREAELWIKGEVR